MARIYHHIMATVLETNGSINDQPLCASDTQVWVKEDDGLFSCPPGWFLRALCYPLVHISVVWGLAHAPITSSYRGHVTVVGYWRFSL